MKTKESQLRASRNYRLRNPEKVKETCRRYAENYYNDPIKKEIHSNPGTVAMADFRQRLRPKVLTRHLGDL